MNTGQAVTRIAAAVLAATTIAACSSSANHTASPPTSAKQAASSDEATGTPILIGWLGQSLGVGSEFSDPIGRAATDWINATGGVHGRPIRLVTCDDQATPTSVTQCANTFVSDHVSVVTTFLTYNEAALLPALTAAKIPLVEVAPASQTALASPDVIGMTGEAIEGLALPALYGAEHGLKSNVLILLNSASSAGAAVSAKPLYTVEGVSFSDQLVDAGTPDLTAQVTSATRNHPASLSIVGSDSLCSAGLRAAQSIGYTGQIFLAGCSDSTIGGLAGSAINGAIAADPINATSLSASDSATYVSAMKQYAPSIDPDVASGSADFASMSFIRSVLSTQLPASSTYSGSAALAAFKGITNYTYPMDGGIPLTCNGTAIKIMPAVCSSEVSLVKWENQKEVGDGLLDFTSLFSRL